MEDGLGWEGFMSLRSAALYFYYIFLTEMEGSVVFADPPLQQIELGWRFEGVHWELNARYTPFPLFSGFRDCSWLPVSILARGL
jgi:hypothetical protein